MRITTVIIGVLALSLLSLACPRASQTDTAAGDAVNLQAPDARDATAIIPNAPSAAPFDGESRFLRTADGYLVASWYWPPAGEQAPGVILLHMRGRDKSSWGDMPEKLVAEGFAVIAIDLRGHGETLDPQGRRMQLEQLKNADYLAMLGDVAAAHQALSDDARVDGDRVGIIGASIGANLAIMYAAGDKRVRTAVALSPGLNYMGLEPLGYLEGYDARALYLIAAEGDETAFESCEALEKATAADPVSFRHFEGRDHGTDLLTAHPGLDMTIISGWLLNHLPPQR